MALDGSPLDRIARGLASGMSRREALRAGGAVLVGAAAITPADAWAAVTGHCPHHRVRCHGSCCPAGEVCLPPKHKGGKHRCGCAHHKTRCGGKCVDQMTDVRHCGPKCTDCTQLNFVERVHCSKGTCVIDQCAPNWVDCDHKPFNGCETFGSVCP